MHTKEENITVKLLAYTPEPEKIITSAAKLCYSKSDIESLMEKQDDETIAKFLNMIMKVGHTSILEHASFTFGIENVSRITEIQLARKRTGKFSIQSGRYVLRDNANYIIPPQILESEKATLIYLNQLEQAHKAYMDIIEILQEENPDRNIKQIIEDARYIQPQAVCTKIVFTIDLGNLMKLIASRRCKRAQWEIRAVINLMIEAIEPLLPNISKYIGAPCETGTCPEGNMCCGKPYAKKVN